MSEHYRETAFLKKLIRYDDTEARCRLEEQINQAERNERCVRVALYLVALVAGLAVAGLCYSAVFLPDFPQNTSQVVLKLFGALGLGSTICLVCFFGVWLTYRRELNRRREAGRKFVVALLDTHFGRVDRAFVEETVIERNIIVYQNETVPPAPDMLKLPKAS
jgi:putative copper export protein